MNELPPTEIQRAAEDKVCEVKFKSFIKRAHDQIIQYFDCDTDWVVVEDGIDMKKYKCSHSELEYLHDNDEFVFVVDFNSKHVSFMTVDYEILMVFGFGQLKPELAVNKDVKDEYLPMLIFLVDLFTKSFKIDDMEEN